MNYYLGAAVMSLITSPASVKPKMAVICATVPLVCALRKVVVSIASSALSPRLDSSSSLYTHKNLRDGRRPRLLKRLRRARANGHPFIFQNSATRIRVGSIFSAAPIEENRVALLLHAVSISSTLSFSESMASIT